MIEVEGILFLISINFANRGFQNHNQYNVKDHISRDGCIFKGHVKKKMTTCWDYQHQDKAKPLPHSIH